MDPKPVQRKSDLPPKPPCNIVKGYGGRPDIIFNQTDSALLKDNFTTSTWLLIGATLQILLFLLPIRPSYALAPAVLLLAYRFTTNLLICFGLKRNPYLDGVTAGKRAAIYPSPSSSSSEKGKPVPGSEEICVFLITARCNHPLGLLAPGYHDLAEHFKRLVFVLDSAAPSNGFLGGSTYVNANDRSASSEIMSVIYFRSYEALYAFAHEAAHREAWDWWNEGVKRHGHLAIGHEVYSVPEGRWENIYVNYHESNFGATAHLVKDENGKDTWVNPLVDARRGRLRTSQGRMGISQTGDENNKYGDDPYAEV